MTWYPPNEGLNRWITLCRQVTLSNGAEPDAGRRLLKWAHEALRSAELPAVVPEDAPSSTLPRSAPWLAAGALALLALAGLRRDPAAVALSDRLAAPSDRFPFGADVLGRDTLARFGHGAVLTAPWTIAAPALGWPCWD